MYRSPELSTATVLRALPLAALAGLLVSVLMLVGVELFDKSVKGPDSLQALLPQGAIYLGTVGRMRA